MTTLLALWTAHKNKLHIRVGACCEPMHWLSLEPSTWEVSWGALNSFERTPF